jgi:hypothetical protein
MVTDERLYADRRQELLAVDWSPVVINSCAAAPTAG